jgi:hypothetical protein
VTQAEDKTQDRQDSLGEIPQERQFRGDKDCVGTREIRRQD